MNAIEMKTLMTMPEDTLVPWGDLGKMITVAEALGRVLKGEGLEASPAAPPAPGQPGYQAGPNIRISQRAVDNLSQAQYDELQATGHIQGLTNSDNGRAMVHVRQGGSYSANFSFDPETGKVGPGRPMDLSQFDDPSAASK